MRRAAFLLLAIAGTPGVGRGQAPDWAVLWRVVDGTLPSPAALQRGPTGVYWNPAAAREQDGLSGGVEVLHTSEAVSVSGVFGVLVGQLGRGSLGLTAGRMAVGDLVRTSTSPIADAGEIPVFAQFVGGLAAVSFGSLAVGVEFRAHDARLDTRSDGGVTADVGVQYQPIGSLTLAGATHFAALGFDGRPTTDYYAAAEYRIGTSRVWGAPAVVSARYGLDVVGSGEVEHGVSAGLSFGGRLRVDAGYQREVAFETPSWRFALGLAFRAGRYVISASRGSSLNDAGATYRLGLSAGLLQ